MRREFGEYIIDNPLVATSNAKLDHADRDGQAVVIKTPTTTPGTFHLQREISILDQLRNENIPNVIKLDGYGSIGPWTPFLATEFQSGGTLGDVLKSTPDTEQLKRYMSVLGNTAFALTALHDINIIHCDVKPSNVFAETGYLADFDGSIRYAEIDYASQYTRCTYGQCAPELYEFKPSFASDCWGLGNTAYQLITGQSAFGNPENSKVASRIVQNVPKYRPDELNKIIPSSVSDVVYESLNPDPNNRPSAEDMYAVFGEN